MGDRSSFLCPTVPDSGDSTPALEAAPHASTSLHTDERLPMPASPAFHQDATQESQQQTHADPRRSSPTTAKPFDTSSIAQEEEGAGDEAASHPLRSFFSVHPDRAAAVTLSPAEEDADTQRRWRVDAADVEVYLSQLDTAREECARIGYYTKALACMQRMEQAVRLFAKRLHSEADTVAARTRARLTEQQKLQRLELRRQWREKNAAYKHNAATLVAAAEQHHYAQLEKEDTQMRSELHPRYRVPEGSSNTVAPSPAWSKEVQHLQYELQQFLRQRRYADAERLRAQLQRLERRETTDHERAVTQQHLQRLQTLKAAHAAALADMQAVHRQEVHAMVQAGREALEDLEQNHLAALQAVEDRRQRLHEQNRGVLRAYEAADVLDPKAAGLKLIRLSHGLWMPPAHLQR